jgi:hypothetical protein
MGKLEQATTLIAEDIELIQADLNTALEAIKELTGETSEEKPPVEDGATVTNENPTKTESEEEIASLKEVKETLVNIQIQVDELKKEDEPKNEHEPGKIKNQDLIKNLNKTKTIRGFLNRNKAHNK